MMLINENAITDYSHLITTQPHDIRRVIISDLHLSADEPALVQAFLALIDDLLVLPHLKQFYILGDWFDAWVGDDSYLTLSPTETKRHWLTPIIDKLFKLSNRGCQIKIMHGNRDFLIGQAFCDLFQGDLIFEPYYLDLGDARVRLEHGDALCTDDKSYQRFRAIMRSPITQWILLRRPLHKRIKLANKIRQKSALNKSTKSMTIMDVNQGAVNKALKSCDSLLHGHTHRPALHRVITDPDINITNRNKPNSINCNSLSDIKIRYVLGDWRLLNPNSSCKKVEAVIAVTVADSNSLNQNEALQLIKFSVKT